MDMKNNNPNVDDGQGRASNPDIPALKKDVKERKGGGVVSSQQGSQVGKQGFFSRLFSGGGGGSGSSGVLVRGGAVKIGASGGIKGLLASKLGIAAISLGLGGTGLIGFGSMQRNVAQRGIEEAEGLRLGAISSTISAGKRNAKGSRSLNFAQQGGSGQIAWGDGKNAPQAPSGNGEETDTADAPAEAPGVNTEDMMKDMMGQAGAGGGGGAGGKRLEGGFGKMSSSLGGSGASVGGGAHLNSMDGGKFAIKQMEKLGNVKDLGRGKQTARGRAGGMSRGSSGRLAKSMSTRKGFDTPKTMNQLRFANNMSRAGSMSETGTGQAAYAADAFEQQTGAGVGGAPGIGRDGSGGTSTLGEGGGGGGGNAGMAPMAPANAKCNEYEELTPDGFCLPRIDQGHNVGDMMDKTIKRFEREKKAAEDMAKMGQNLILIGLALIALSYIPFCGFLAVIGVALMIVGALMMALGHSQKKEAERSLEDTLGEKMKQEDLAANILAEDEAKRQEILEKLRKDKVNPNDPDASGIPGTFFWHEGEMWKWGKDGKGEKIEDDVTFADGSQYKANGDGNFEYWKPGDDGTLIQDEDPDGWKAASELRGEKE